jgi:[protein-PII] uridylyltransferase
VVASDRPGLLASIAAAISASKLEIHAAQVHSRPLPGGGSQAVDLFWVHGPRGDQSGVAETLPKLQRLLREVVTGKVQARDLVKGRRRSRWGRPTPAVFTEVVIDHRASSAQTVIEVLSEDRPGLLFKLAQTLHALGLTITVAKINTEGTRVIDVFYVTELDGRKLDPGTRSDEVRKALLACLQAD